MHDAAQCRHEPLAARSDDAIDLVAAGAEDLDQLTDVGAVGQRDPKPDEIVLVVGALLELLRDALQVRADQGFRRLA